jgi:hypothetical protein
MTAGEAEGDLLLAGPGEEVLGPQANHRVGALLKVSGSHIHVEDGVVSPLVAFAPAVEEANLGPPGLDRQLPQPGAEAP